MICLRRSQTGVRVLFTIDRPTREKLSVEDMQLAVEPSYNKEPLLFIAIQFPFQREGILSKALPLPVSNRSLSFQHKSHWPSTVLSLCWDQRKLWIWEIITVDCDIMNGCCRKEPSTIMVHCRMLENTAQAQQESLGILGVNLIHSAMTLSKQPNNILKVSHCFSLHLIDVKVLRPPLYLPIC